MAITKGGGSPVSKGYSASTGQKERSSHNFVCRSPSILYCPTLQHQGQDQSYHSATTYRSVREREHPGLVVSRRL